MHGCILSPEGNFVPWLTIHPGRGDCMGEKAYLALLSYILIVPIIEADSIVAPYEGYHMLADLEG